jgi:hypothetical protein
MLAALSLQQHEPGSRPTRVETALDDTERSPVLEVGRRPQSSKSRAHRGTRGAHRALHASRRETRAGRSL